MQTLTPHENTLKNRNKFGRTILATAALLLLSTASRQEVPADTPNPHVVLTPSASDLVVGPRMNAAGRDLRGCEIVGQNLTDAIFDGCNLYKAKIADCNLKGASFRDVVFIGSHVEAHYAEGADFTNATINEVWGSTGGGFNSYSLKLSPRQLMSTWSYRNKDLHECAISGSDWVESGKAVSLDLRGADLRRAEFLGDCSGCDFADATIQGASFGHRSVTREQIASTSDFKRRFLHVRLALYTAEDDSKWDFSRFTLAGSDLWYPPADADFTDANIANCSIHHGLTKQQLYTTASYKRGDLRGLRLEWSDLSGCDFSGMDLTGCLFSHCRFGGATFSDAVLTNTKFVTDKRIAAQDQLSPEQIKDTWNYKHGNMQGIRLTEEIAAALKQEQHE